MSTNEQSNIDILIEQVGRMTEGITETRLMVQEVARTTQQQAVVAAQQAESIKQLTEGVNKQAESVNQLILMLGQKS
jgi:methyl-accepting chemotaxis protein